jgi:hypothetical protein
LRAPNGAYAHYVLGWSSEASWLTGVALSTTSAAVVYALILELGLNSTGFGKAVVAACFVRDLGTVVALGDAAAWADSEAVLPPHLVGMVLAPRRSARGHVIPLSTNTVHTSAKASVASHRVTRTTPGRNATLCSLTRAATSCTPTKVRLASLR